MSRSPLRSPLLCCAWVLWLWSSIVSAQPTSSPASAPTSQPSSQPNFVTKIELQIRGFSRKEEELRKLLQQRENAAIDEAAIRQDIRAIFALGKILDVRVEHLDSGVLRYEIEEWPEEIDYEIKGKRPPHLETYEYIPYRYFTFFINPIKSEEITLQKLQNSSLEVQENLQKFGYLNATVDATVHIKKSKYYVKSIIVEYNISLGEKYTVGLLEIKGNDYFSEKELNDIIVTEKVKQERKKRKRGHFSKNILENDLLVLQSKYFTNGFLDVEVSQNHIINDKNKTVDIEILIKEGEQYRFGNIKVDEGLEIPDIKSGEIYKIDKTKQYLAEMTQKYQNQGYANISVIPEVNIDKKEHTVSVDFKLNKGELFYFGKINKDLGIKKEQDRYNSFIEFKTGDLYSFDKIERTKKNLKNKQDFSRVEIRTEISDVPNVLDVQIVASQAIVEGGRFMAYSSLEEAAWLYHYGTLNNAFGYGNIIESQYRLFRDEQLLSFGLLRNLRYGQTVGVRGFWVDPVTRDYDTEGDPEEDDFIDLFDMNEPLQTNRRLGASFLLRQPLTKKLSASLQYSLYQQKEISRAEQFLEELDGSGRRALLEARLVFDSRDFGDRGHEGDRGGFTSSGWFFSAQGGLSSKAIGSTQDFANISLRGARFFSLIEGGRTDRTPGGVTLKLVGRYDALMSLGDGEIPFSERYLLGGMGSLRGVLPQSVGPVLEGGGNIGGTVAYGGSLEVELPFVDELGDDFWRRFRWALFADAAYTDGGTRSAVQVAPHQDFGLPLRTAAGVSLRWYVSYLYGPMRLDIARPLDIQPGEGVQLHFSISTEL